MATTLRNRTRQPRTFILHSTAEAAEGLPKVAMTVHVERHNPATGDRSVNPLRRTFPASITLQPAGVEGDEIAGLADQVLLVAEIAAAAKAGLIEVSTVPDVQEPPPAPTGDVPSDAPRKRSKES